MTKKSVKLQAGRMSRMTTSCASLSWAMPAMRRACSSGVRAGMLAAVEAEFVDQLADRGRNEPVDRLSARDPVADLTGRNRQRLDLEEQHTLGPLQRGENVVETPARITRARRNCEPRQVPDLGRAPPGEESGALV